MSSAATHAFLPLLACDESVRLQLLAGRAAHERLFGRVPAGCWLPECAYRPRGAWAPWPQGAADGAHSATRAGIEEHLAAAGYRFVVVDAHLARAGRPLEAYHTAFTTDLRTDITTAAGSPARAPARAPGEARRSPYQDYTIGRGPDAVRALVRDAASTQQVWSRDEGYPGGAAYAEFHKLRWPGGLRLWAVTGPRVSLGDKRPYDAARARALARDHAQHFADLLGGIAHGRPSAADRVIVAPFDSELFGHWWLEGPDFLADSFRALRSQPAVRPVTASGHIGSAGIAMPIDLPAGSWGRGGDFSMWLNDQTTWMWRRLWALERRFWHAAPAAVAVPAAWPVLAQAARELLLAQASDWQFIVSTGEVADYGDRRFRLHADAVDSLVAALERGGDLDGAAREADALYARDTLFPDVLDAVAASLMGAAAPAQGG